MIQTQENGEKTPFGPNLGPLIWVAKFLFQKSGFVSH